MLCINLLFIATSNFFHMCNTNVENFKRRRGNMAKKELGKAQGAVGVWFNSSHLIT